MSVQPGFVLDGSVTLAWYFADEADAYADEVGRQLPSVAAIVPTIWPLEVANAVLMGERRKRSTSAQAATWISQLQALPITVDDETSAHALGAILSLARLQGLSAYGAAYFDLAMRRGLPLASLDDRLKSRRRGCRRTARCTPNGKPYAVSTESYHQGFGMEPSDLGDSADEVRNASLDPVS